MRLERSNSTHLNATHEAVANLLGVRRESISQVAGKLQKIGIIHYSRGKLEVLDGAKVEHLSCECYFVVRKETDRLLPRGGAGQAQWARSVSVRSSTSSRTRLPAAIFGAR